MAKGLLMGGDANDLMQLATELPDLGTPTPSPMMQTATSSLATSKPQKGKTTKSEMGTTESNKKSVKRDLYTDPNTLASRFQGIEDLPMFQEQQRGIKEAENMLSMARGQQEVPNYDHIVQPFLSLTDAWTGSRMSQNFKPTDTEKKSRNVASLQDDIQKRRETYNKQLIDALNKSKEGTESTEQTQQLKEMLARAEGFNMGKGSGDGAPKSKYQEQLDSAFGKEAASYIAGGGYTRVQKNLDELDGIIHNLKSGKKNLSGPLVGIVPQGLRSSIPGLRDSAYTQQRVAGVIQQSLREILGAQFTEAEGKRLLSTAYDPNASEEENADRLQAAVDELRAKAQQKLESAKYADEFGTLKGYGGTSRVSGTNKSTAPKTKTEGAPKSGAVEKVTVQKDGKKYNLPKAQLASALEQGYTEVK